MSVETFSMSDVLSVSQTARKHFASQLEKSGKRAIRVSLKESGCTGFKYVIDEVEQGEDKDISLHLDDGVLLLIDGKHIGSLRGTHIDYVKEGLNHSIVMSNPNVQDACGCGESFSFK